MSEKKGTTFLGSVKKNGRKGKEKRLFNGVYVFDNEEAEWVPFGQHREVDHAVKKEGHAFHWRNEEILKKA